MENDGVATPLGADDTKSGDELIDEGEEYEYQPALEKEAELPTLGVVHLLRFAAVLHVVLWTFYTPSNVDTSDWMEEHMRWFISWGVSQFGFLVVMSGFILGYRYSRSVNTEEGFMMREFFVKRLARWPVALVAMILPGWSNPQRTFGSMKKIINFVFTMFGIAPWVPEKTFEVNVPLWAVGVMILLYAIFPVLVNIFGRMDEMDRRIKCGVIFGLWGGSFLLTFGLYSMDKDLKIWSTTSPFLYVIPFVMGLMTGEMCVNRVVYDREGWQKSVNLFAGSVALGILVLWYILVPTYQHWGTRTDLQNVVFYWNHTGTLSLLQCLCLYWLNNGSDVLGVALSLPPVYLLGWLAPTIYMFHVPVWEFAHKFNDNHDLFFWVSLAVMAFVGYFLLELPFYEWALESYRAIGQDKEEDGKDVDDDGGDGGDGGEGGE